MWVYFQNLFDLIFFIHRSAKKDCAHELRICSYNFI